MAEKFKLEETSAGTKWWDQAINRNNKKVEAVINTIIDNDSTSGVANAELALKVTELESSLETVNSELNEKVNYPILDWEYNNSNLLVSNILYPYYDLRRYGVDNEGLVDASEKINLILSAMYKVMVDSNSFNKENVLLIPSGKYLINNTINLNTFITLKTIGQVTFLNNVSVCINVISPETRMFDDGSQIPWTKKTLIDSEYGMLIINSNDKTNVGLSLGATNVDDASGMSKFCAYSKFKGLNLRKFENAIRISPINTFLLEFDSVTCEANNKAILYDNWSGAQKMNSGENIKFNNCIFGNNDIAFENNLNDIDIYFNHCSFDFNKYIFNPKYSCNVNISESHIETGTGNSIFYPISHNAYKNFNFNNCFVMAKLPYIDLNFSINASFNNCSLFNYNDKFNTTADNIIMSKKGNLKINNCRAYNETIGIGTDNLLQNGFLMSKEKFTIANNKNTTYTLTATNDNIDNEYSGRRLDLTLERISGQNDVGYGFSIKFTVDNVDYSKLYCLNMVQSLSVAGADIVVEQLRDGVSVKTTRFKVNTNIAFYNHIPYNFKLAKNDEIRIHCIDNNFTGDTLTLSYYFMYLQEINGIENYFPFKSITSDGKWSLS